MPIISFMMQASVVFTLHLNCVEVNKLYIFFNETGDAWMLKNLTEVHLQAWIQYLYNILEDDILDQKIGSAFGQLYLYHNSVC